MNGWYDRINTMMPVPVQQAPRMPMMPNPMQRMSQVMQAMQNPMTFVRQNLKGIPEELFNDPTGNAILQYMQNNMGVTQQDIQNAASQIPRR